MRYFVVLMDNRAGFMERAETVVEVARDRLYNPA